MYTRIQYIELDPDLYLYKECSNFTYFIIIFILYVMSEMWLLHK